MSKIPVPLFPLSAVASKPGGFVVAVLIGLAIFAATRPTLATNGAPPPR